MKKITFNPAKDKVLIASKEVAQKDWNKHLPFPLKENEKCVTDSDQSNVSKGFVRVKRRGGKSVFSISHFTNISGQQYR